MIRPGASAAALATRNRRVGVIATPATIRSHAYFAAIKDENPAVEVYEHATPTLVPLVEAGQLSRTGGRGGRGRGARAAARRARRGRRVHLPQAARRLDRHAAARLHPLPAAPRGHRRRRSGSGVAIVDSATATASALAELLGVNGLETPVAGGRRAAVHLSSSRPATRTGSTTWPSRLFGAAFPDVERVDLGVPAG